MDGDLLCDASCGPDSDPDGVFVQYVYASGINDPVGGYEHIFPVVGLINFSRDDDRASVHCRENGGIYADYFINHRIGGVFGGIVFFDFSANDRFL